MAFIALEGCDGSGKSTVADAVIQTLKKKEPKSEIRYMHFSQLDNDPIDEYALQFEDYRPGSGVHIVCDRLHWGELIYGPLYRLESALSDPAYRWVEMYLRARGATVFHVSASLDTIRKRLSVRGEDYLEDRDVEYVWNEFSRVAGMSLTSGGTMLTDEWETWDIAEHIVNDALYNESVAQESFRPEYIGRSLPTVLFVGDKQGNSNPGVTSAPFMPRGSSSGAFLMGSMPEEWWHRVGIVNVNETNIQELNHVLFSPALVALGKNASDALDKAGLDHAVIPHPQKVRRFHNSLQHQYGTLQRMASEDQGNHISWPN